MERPPSTQPCHALAVVAAWVLVSAAASAAPEAAPSPAELPAQVPKHGDRLPPEVPRPDYMRRRPTLPDFLLEHKRDGFYLTAMPAIGFDTDTGLNLGAFAELYWNGSPTDPYFRSTPYRHKVFIGAVGSTKGRTQAFVATDSPYVFETPYRIQSNAGVEENSAARYFGVGNEAMERLFLPPVPGTSIPMRRFETYRGFEKEKDKAWPAQPGGSSGEQGLTYTKFDQYQMRRWYGRFQLERDTFGGIVRPLVGLQLSYVDVSDYSGKSLRANDFGGSGEVEAVQLPTRLRTDCDRGRVVGCGDGWDNLLKLGVVVDTLDFEPDPRNGIFAQVITELSTQLLGSRFNYGRVATDLRGYWSPIPDRADLVLVGRLLFQYQWDRVPFYSLNNYPDAIDIRDLQGLGGRRTVRGYTQDRFVGPLATAVNLEARWTFSEFDLFHQHIELALNPFFDAGRVYDGAGDVTVNDWALGYGVALALKWNLSTVVRFDYGLSSEGTGLYLELTQPF
jgi:Omp85 superfamily domain